jgi:hypothetical protein
MVVRTLDYQEIKLLVEALERDCRDLAQQLEAAEEKLRTLKAVRDFVESGPDAFRPTERRKMSPAHAGIVHPDDIGGFDDDSLAELVETVLMRHGEEMRASGKPPGMKPAEVSKAIRNLRGRKVDGKKVNGRLWYLKSRGEIGWSNGHYFLLENTPDSEAKGNERVAAS